MKLPLTGVRVVDFSKLEIGAGATQALADLGADVIKIEGPDGEPMRRYIPRLGHDSVYYYAVYRNKRSVQVDVSQEKGRQVLLDLVATADAFVEVSRPGGMERLNLAYGDLRAVNPKLVYCSISSYGQSGPAAKQASHSPDIDFAAGVGILREDPGSGEPVMGELLAISALSAMSDAALAIVSGVLGARASGVGSHIEVSMWDSAVSWNPVAATMALTGCALPTGLGSRATPRHAPYRTADSRVINLSCIEHRYWKRFCDSVGRPDLIDEHVGSDATDFGRAELYDEIAQIVMQRTLDDWITTCRDNNIPFGVVHTRLQALESDQAESRGIVWDVDGPDGERYRLVARPTLFDGDRGEVYIAPPSQGAHTDAVLESIGYDSGRLAALRQVGAIV